MKGKKKKRRKVIDRLRILFLEKVMSCPVQEVGREGCSRRLIPAVDISVFLA